MSRIVGGAGLAEPSSVAVRGAPAGGGGGCLHHRIETRAALCPEAVAVVAGRSSLTYGELDRRADCLARRLAALGVGPEAPVGVALERTPDLPAALLAVLKAGGAYVPLDPSYPSRRLAAVLADSGARVVLTTAALAGDLPRSEARALLVDRPEDPGPVALPRAEPDHLAYLIYTSGSSGAPKGVAITHRSAAAFVDWSLAHFSRGELRRVLAASPVAFDLSVFELFVPLAGGGTTVLVDGLLDLVGRREPLPEVTLVNTVPSLLEELLRHRPLPRSVRTVNLAGEALGRRLVRCLHEGSGVERVRNLYGPSEDTTYSTAALCRPGETGAVSIGRPIAGTRAAVLGPGLEPAAAGEPGELCLGGGGLARGYLGRPAATGERFVPDPDGVGARRYRTGDRVRRLADGRLVFLGRLDRQVKLHGVRIELSEIEAVLGEHPEVREAAVIAAGGRDDDARSLVAYVVPEDEASPEPAAGEPGAAEAEQVRRWRTVYDQRYGAAREGSDRAFGGGIWLSSYTGRPIPEPEMASWVDEAVERILALRPSRVLESGCGTGLIAERVAPRSSEYLATDFSAAALSALEHRLAGLEIPPETAIRLERRPAHDFDGLPRDRFDTVILNSVSQHFPGVGYLLRVLRGAAALLAPGGALFVGDVRSLPLLRAFAASVELARSGPDRPVAELAAAVEERSRREEELLVHPELFAALAREIPGAGRVWIEPKAGRPDNELTRFRYDVTLVLEQEGGSAAPRPAPARRAWDAAWDLARLRWELAAERAPALVVEGIPNPRLARSLAALELLAGAEAPATAGELLRRLDALGTPPFAPADLLEAGREAGYTAHLDWRAGRPDGALDLVLHRGAAPDLGRPGVGTGSGPPAWSAYANAPLHRVEARRLEESCRRLLEERLPRPMVPARLVVLDALPRLPNGKVDRRALEALPPPGAADPAAAGDPPRTPAEELLARAFADVLGLESVPRDADFFRLGGHSLAAAGMCARVLESLGGDLPLDAVFDHPTPAALARVLESRTPAPSPEPPLVPVPRAGALPLASGEEGLWLADRLRPGDGAYVYLAAWRLAGPLDRRALARAIEATVGRHEVLRTVFPAREGRAVRRIAPAAAVPVSLLDLAGLEPGAASSARRRAISRLCRNAPDPARGPLVRFVLVRTARREHLLLARLHHIVFDGTSELLMHRELMAAYAEARGERPAAPPPELPVQYADFAAWQRARLAGPLLEDRLAYWRRRLDGLPRLDLPVDRPPPHAPSSRAGAVTFAVDSIVTGALRRLGEGARGSLFVTLLAAFLALLRRWTGQDDLGVASPVDNRSRRELEPLVGFFVNLLVLRVDLGSPEPGLSFSELLERVRTAALEAFARRDLPFDRLVEALAPERTAEASPLARVLFALQGERDPAARAGGVLWAPLELPGRHTRLDLEWHLRPAGDELRGQVLYRRDLFDATTVRRLARSFVTFLAAVARDPDRPLDRLAALDPAERHQLLREWSGGGAGPAPEDAPLLERFERRAAHAPHRTAVTFRGRALTYGELDARARRLAGRLQDRGVRPGDRVGVLLERGPDLLVALLAVWKTGAATVPLDPSHPRRRTAWILGDAGARTLVSGPLAGPFAAEVVPVGADTLAEAPAALQPVPPDADRPAYVLHTSGSTGRPKGVAVSHRSTARFLAALERRLPPGAAERVAAVTTVTFDLSVTELFLPLATGGCGLLIDAATAADGRRLARELERAAPSLVQGTPATYRLLLEAGWRPGPGVTALIGGEALKPELAAALAPRVEALWNCYGPTETTVWATLERVPARPAAAPPPLGRPLAGYRAYVADRGLRPVPGGSAGEICLAGAGVSGGYLGRPSPTAERFVPDPFGGAPGDRLYRTGDLGRWLGDGRLSFLGRADRQLKIRGFRVEAGEIEAVLAPHPGVAEAVVTSAPDPSGEDRLIAHVARRRGAAGEDGAGLSPGSLAAYLEERLPSYMVPSAFVVLDALPRTSRGKVDRRALPEPSAPEGASATASIAQAALAEIWSELLAVERPGPRDDFFRLGGHSLLGNRMIARVAALFGVDLPLGALFEHPTLAGLAAEIEARRGAAAGPIHPPELVPIRRAGEIPVSFGQRRLWFLHRLAPESPAYNVPEAYDLVGPLDLPALARALTELVRRHEVLRTRFPERDGRPCPVIEPPAPAALPVVDLAALPADRRRAELRRLALESALRPFDLLADPPLRALLLRPAPREHRLELAIHHIAFDDASRGILARDLAAAYERFAGGGPGSFPPAPAVQYADFARWQRRCLDPGLRARELAFWRRRLGGLAPLDLPTDRPRPPVPGHRGAAERFVLDPAVTAALGHLARHRGSSLHMVFLAALGALLHRVSGQDDLAVGVPLSHRPRPALEELVGFFVETVVVRLDLRGGPSFGELLDRVRRTALEAYAHQRVPFEHLIEALAPERRLDRNPLFQVACSLLEPPRAERAAAGLRLRPVEPEVATSRFELSLFLRRDGERVAGVLVYDADLFDRTTARRMTRVLGSFLAAAAADPGTGVGDLPFLGAAERHQATVEWNDRRGAGPASADLLDLVRSQARERPDAVAAEGAAEALSFGALARRSAELAADLRRDGVGPETVVGLLLAPSPERTVAALGVLAAGAALLPLDPDDPAERRRALGADAGLLRVIPGPATGLRPAAGVAGRASPPPPADGGAAAYVLYTSGSTGRPKGVVVSRDALANRLLAGREAVPLAPGDRVLQQAAPAFDFSLWELLAPLVSGATAVVLDAAHRGDPGALVEHVERHRVTVAHLVPSLAAAVLESAPAGRMSSLGRLLVGGEALTPALRDRALERLDARVVHQYGPTEATIDATAEVYRRGDVGRRAPVTLGRPLANLEAHVVEPRLPPDRAPAPPGVPGEIALAGVGLARGYLRRPGRTAAVFVPHPWSRRPGERLYRTGDLGRRLPDGRIVFVGRLDRQVKVLGVRVELGEVEAALEAEAGVASAVARVCGGRLVAYYVARPDGAPGPPPDAATLRRRLAARLPRALVPAVLVPVDELPRTASGKVDLARLPEPGRTSEGGATGPSLPRGPLEELVAETWSELLGAGPVGAHDDFFALGGHSLLATRVASRLRTVLGVELQVRTLFERRTPAELAAYLAEDLAANPTGDSAPGAGSAPPPLRPMPRPAEPPLSFAQRRLWFLDRLEGPSPAYVMPSALRFDGELDRAALARALRGVVRRHESLRTGFDERSGRPVQVLLAAREATAALALPVLDLSRLSPGRAAREADRVIRGESERPFDLRRPSLLRPLLLALGDGAHLLLTVLHHIVSDGWSTGVLQGELVAAYRGLAGDSRVPLPELPVQYADYALWQRAWLRGEVRERLLAYWRPRLAGARDLELPTDRPRPATPSARGAARELTLGAPLAAGLRSLGRRAGASLYMTLLAAFAALLGRIAATTDVTVGTPVAGRDRQEIEGLIGFFVNTLALRLDLADRPSFGALLARARETALGAYAHQNLPFEALVEALALPRELGRRPLFQVLLAVHNAPRPAAVELPGLRIRELDLPERSVRFDLELHVREAPEGLRAVAVYDRDLFDATTVERWLRHFAHLLGEAVRAPGRPVDALPLLERAERHQLVCEAVDRPTEPTPPPVAHRQVARAGRVRPDAVAVTAGTRHLTYGELLRRAERLARGLQALGVREERVVALTAHPSPELAVALLGVLAAGAAVLPLDPTFPGERLAFMVEDSDAALLLAPEDALRDAPAALPALTVEQVLAAGGGAGPSPGTATREPGADSLAYLVYTSGSTGRPKGVAMGHGLLARLIAWQSEPGAAGGPHGGGSRTLQLASPSFDVFFQESLSTWASGGTLVIPEPGTRRDPRRILRTVTRERIERLFLPPVALDALARTPVAEGSDPRGVRRVIAAGERLRLSEPVVRWLEGLGAGTVLSNHYGPSETHVVTALDLAGPPREWPLLPSVGRALPHAAVHLLARDLEPTPLGIAGELYVGGDALARGYAHRPALSAERFVPDPFTGRPGGRLYRTGDLARRRPRALLELLGRLDGQVKIRGFRVEVGEVEAVLETHPGVAQAVVSPHDAAPDDRCLAAYLVPAGDAAPDAAALGDWLRERLPEFMVPRTFTLLDALPLTATGKVDRKRLPAPVAAPRPPRPEPPATPVEAELAGLWAEVLGLEAVGVDEDFFRLGGHSLLAVRLMARIEERFGVELPLAALFRDSTVRRLGRRLGELGAARETAAAPRRPRAPEAARLVVLQGEGASPPVVLVHPAGGSALCYGPLARHLAGDRAGDGARDGDRDRDGEAGTLVFALEDPGPPPEGAGGAAMPGLRARARAYLAIVERLETPLRLVGWSMGGVLAYEMARQARSRGLEVTLLALIDAWAPEPGGAFRAAGDRSAFARDLGLRPGADFDPDELAAGSPAEAATLLARATGGREPDRGLRPDLERDLERRLRLFEAHVAAMRRYRPRPYAGPVLLFRALGGSAAGDDPTLGWGELVPALEVVPIPGDHFTVIRGPGARLVARHLEWAGRGVAGEAPAAGPGRGIHPTPR